MLEVKFVGGELCHGSKPFTLSIEFVCSSSDGQAESVTGGEECALKIHWPTPVVGASGC